MTGWSVYALTAVSLFCLVRAIWDLKQRRYVWALAGFASAAALMLMPISSHAVKIDIPITDAR